MTLPFAAVVEDVRERGRRDGRVQWEMSLSVTEFAAGEQGTLTAVSRGGVRLEIPVLDVRVDAEGHVWHVVEKPLAADTEIVGWVRRRT